MPDLIVNVQPLPEISKVWSVQLTCQIEDNHDPLSKTCCVWVCSPGSRSVWGGPCGSKRQDATWCHLRLVIIIVNKAHTRGVKGDIINLSNLATVWDTEIYFLDSSSLSREILSCKSRWQIYPGLLSSAAVFSLSRWKAKAGEGNCQLRGRLWIGAMEWT